MQYLVTLVSLVSLDLFFHRSILLSFKKFCISLCKKWDSHMTINLICQKNFDFYDMERLFISIVFCFKPYLSVNYFNNFCLSQFDGSSSDLMNQYFAVTYVVREYCFMNTWCPCTCVSTLFKNKKVKLCFKYSTSTSILYMKENKKRITTVTRVQNSIKKILRCISLWFQ